MGELVSVGGVKGRRKGEAVYVSPLPQYLSRASTTWEEGKTGRGGEKLPDEVWSGGGNVSSIFLITLTGMMCDGAA